MAITVFELLRLLSNLLRKARLTASIRHLFSRLLPIFRAVHRYLLRCGCSFVAPNCQWDIQKFDSGASRVRPDTKSLDSATICASSVPSSAATLSVDHVVPVVEYNVQPPSSPGSVASSPERHSLDLEPNSLRPYPLSNASLSSQNVARGDAAGDQFRRSASHLQLYSPRPLSRASSRIRSHVNNGIYTVSSSVDLPRDLGLSLSQINIVVRQGAIVDEEKGGSGAETTLYHSRADIRKPMYPTLTVERYNRNIILPRRTPDYQYTIRRLTTTFPREGIPDGWLACVHPEGALYYFKEDQRIYTDANLCDPTILHEIESFAASLEEYARDECITIPPGSELVLELEQDGSQDYVWSYYFADPGSKTLFWLHDFDITWWISELVGETSPSHIKLEIERYFWMHVEYFPSGHTITGPALDELTGVLIHALADTLTSISSTVPFSTERLSKMLTITKESRVHGSSDYSIVAIARFNSLLAHPRFLNYHGEHGARLNRDQVLHGGPKKYTFLTWSLTPVLFNAHYSQLKKLEEIWIDMTVCQEPWALFIEDLKVEWREVTTGASVTLIVAVVFLSLSGLDNNPSSRSPVKTLSYISAAASVGSVILGTVLRRQYRDKPIVTVEEAAKFLYSKTLILGGIETLAIVYSLPYVFMVWGILLFVAALSYGCFITRDRGALFASGVAWILITLPILCCLWAASFSLARVSWKQMFTAIRWKVKSGPSAWLHTRKPSMCTTTDPSTSEMAQSAVPV